MADTSLDLSAFPQFLEEVHGHQPFPWQLVLAERVFQGEWPHALDLPTGSGKTSAIDVAVFHLACQIDPASPEARRAPLRILFVVDRRIVVDDVRAHAKRIAGALAEPGGPVTRLVAERLFALSEPNRPPLKAVQRPGGMDAADRGPSEPKQGPLKVVRLRGGVPKEPDWARTPSQPTVVVSTVDQVGSRLLFRGYGVSPSMRPVHAGLLGSDALLLLDEAHLARPFVETARAIRDHQQALDPAPLPPRPLQVVTLSATQADMAPGLLSDADREHPVLGPRLAASKLARLVGLPCKADTQEHVEAIVDHARRLACPKEGERPAAVAVIVNRVRRARRVFEALREEKEADVVLLTGRARPLARNRLVEDVLPRIRAERAPDAAPRAGRPVIVVATQCIEVGADLDFDALVTEIAPLDSLRQRFGRLDRMGRCEVPARACIVAASDQIGARSKPDPVYGRASAETWKWLTEHASSSGRGKKKVLEIDFGVQAFEARLPSDPDSLAPLLVEQPHAPVMHPAFLERWSRTSPEPTDEADVSLFLHGPESRAEVQIVWRADLGRPARDFWRERVAVCPPSTLEAISVPIWEARRWLQGFKGHSDLSDLASSPQPEDAESRRRARQILRWGGTAESSELIYATDVRPGDVLVVPAADGGCDAWGWNPASRESVEDLAFEANRAQRGREVLRLVPQLLEKDILAEWNPSGDSQSGEDTGDPEARTSSRREEALEKARRAAGRLEECLDSLVDASDEEVVTQLRALPGLPTRWREMLSAGDVHLLRFDGAQADEHVDGAVVGLPLALVRRLGRAQADPATEDDESSVRSLRPVLLKDHSRGVADRARTFAAECGLPKALIEDVELAAYLHDAGKAHRDFKLWLHAGDELAAMGPALAKSGRRRIPPRARRLAGLPKGARHELASLALAEAHPKLREAHDPGLVLWLIGTHHGWGRPFFPGVEWPGEGDEVALDLGDGHGLVKGTMRRLAELTARWLELRDELSRRYGPWGLARLETILRLADHRRSESEQESTANAGQQEQATP